MPTEVMTAASNVSHLLGAKPLRQTVSAQFRGISPRALEVALPATASLGEGPIWDGKAGKLIWVDILEPAIHRFDPSSRLDDRTQTPSTVSAVAMTHDGQVIAALKDSVAIIDLDDGSVREIAKVDGEPQRNRFNDGRVDPNGNFWIGSMSMVGEASAGSLFRLEPCGRFEKILDGIGTSNGIGWSPDGRHMYLTDTMVNTIYRFDYDLDYSTISGKKVFATVPESHGKPDGLSVDSQGCIWSAHWEGWRVTCYDSDGRIVRVLKLPVPRPTSCAFGGADLMTLYITTARVNMTAEELNLAPLSGSLFALPVGTPGLPESLFGRKRV